MGGEEELRMNEIRAALPTWWTRQDQGPNGWVS